jgi:hypothetical protein
MGRAPLRVVALAMVLSSVAKPLHAEAARDDAPLIDRAGTLADVATVTFIIGGVGVGAGVVLAILPPTRDVPAPPRRNAMLHVGVRAASRDHPLQAGRCFRLTLAWSFSDVPQDSEARSFVDGEPLVAALEGEYPSAVPPGNPRHLMKLSHETAPERLGVYDELVVYSEALTSP